MRWVLIVVALVGCADVPDSDVDGDGLADTEDDCIAGEPDEAADVDGDGKDATQDLCPHDANAVAGDNDADGIPEACDPFPVDTVRPDTRRCVTSFGVRWMNASYLVGRAGESAWNLTPRAIAPDKTARLRASASETVAIFSSFETQYRTTTYDLIAHASIGVGASFMLFMRADPDQVSNKDVACGVDDKNLFVWADNAKHALVPLPETGFIGFRLRATINPTTVLCRVSMGGPGMATTYAVTMPRGLYGFRAQGADITIESLVVDSNDSAQPF